MDIIDIVVARALTPQGQIESYAAQAQQAIVNANTAINNINTITQQTNTNNENSVEAMNNAAEALAKAQQAYSEAQQAISDLDTIDNFIDEKINDFQFNMIYNTRANYLSQELDVIFPDGTHHSTPEVVRYYTELGNNENGTMTQKAITLAIQNSGGGSGGGGTPSPTNLGPENAGKIVIVNTDGTIVAGEVLEEDIITSLIKSDSYIAKDAVGLEIDYENKNCTRTQDGSILTPGEGFNNYSMYGGRMRCNVADDGTINAFYGQSGYKDDGSNGQVMVYQPKFYYQRIPLSMKNNGTGQLIKKESLIISPTAQAGFKLHPLFKNTNGEELDYVLLPAYEGSAFKVASNEYDLNDSASIDFSVDKLSSISGAKPISGVNKALTMENAEQLAENRGEGWHITNLAAESALQMLEIVEFGTLNGQAALEDGIVSLASSLSVNCSSITGSTASLGNETGNAFSTVNEINGNRTTYTEPGYRAISYRGMENPWGNIWRFVGGVSVSGNGTQSGGIPYICTNFNYNYSELAENYESTRVALSSSSNYISAFGYGNTKYDWAFLPCECSGANSGVPVGDYIWTTGGLNGKHLMIAGGTWAYGTRAGIFSAGYDHELTYSSNSINARLMFIPTKNNIYLNNIAKWNNIFTK